MSVSQLFRARRVAVPLGLVAAFALGGSVVATSLPAQPQQAAPLVAPAPTYISGARVLSVGPADAQAYSSAAGATLVSVYSPIAAVYTTSGAVAVPLKLPGGAIIVQIDVYGYHVIAGPLTWYLTDWDPTLAKETDIISHSFSGTGIVHGVISPTLAQGTHALGHSWALWTYATTNFRFVGAVIQYVIPSLSLVPVTPFRVLDTRIAALGPKVASGAPRTIKIKDSIDSTGAVVLANAVPFGVFAISYNLTVTGTEGSGWVALIPGTGTTPSASAINWSAAGTTIANGGVLALGVGTAEREITIVVGGSHSPKAHVILDITGLYVSEAG